MALLQDTITVLMTTPVGGTPDPVQIPRWLGHVKLGELLGAGASGAVFSAFDDALSRPVAVKVLHQFRGSAKDVERARFIEGVRSAARIKHPGIVTVHSVDAVGDMPYVVMELIDGLTLRDWQRRAGAVDPALALHIMKAIAQAVAALHDAQIVHRDLKPANVMFDRAGFVHVCDFGLACDVNRDTGGGAAIAGSPLYMAPESFGGGVSPPTDVYALGVMLFELLVGRPPFSAETIEQMRAQHLSTPVPLEWLEERRLPDELNAVVERALHKQRIMRYKSAGHFLRAIEDVSASRIPDEVHRKRIAALVVAPAAAVEAARTPDPPAATTFDLIAQRARAKRESKGG